MTLSINLHSIKCLSESNELSFSDEPYVLVTAVALPPSPAAGPGLGDVRTHLYGPWEMDEDDVLDIVMEGPFWGLDSEPVNIPNPSDVLFLVTLMENDAGSPDGYRQAVQTFVTATLATSLTAPTLAARKARILTDLRSFLDGYPTNNVPFVPSDDHIGTEELVLNNFDLIPFGFKDLKMTIDGGSEGKYELVFRIARHQRTVFTQTAHLTALSRHDRHLEIWGIDVTGTVCGNWLDGRWQGWYRLGGLSFFQDTYLTSLTRHDNHMEIWAVGQDGFVHGKWFENGWHDWYRMDDLVPVSARFRQATPLAAVTRHPNHMELWGVDETGLLRHCWYESGHWHGWNTLALPDGEHFPPGSQLAALSRHAGHMEVWVLDDNGILRGIHFLEDSWRNWITFDGASFAPGTHIEVLSRHADHMELFAVDKAGILRGNRFDGQWKPEFRWYPFANASFNPGTDVAAVSRHPDRMEVWVMGKGDGMVRGNWFDNGAWQADWYVLDNAQFNAASDLAAVSRSYVRGNHGVPGHSQEMMELWCVGWDGFVRGRWFDGQWHGWYALPWSFEG